MDRCDLKNLIHVVVNEQHQIKISNRFAALENLVDNADSNRKVLERVYRLQLKRIFVIT
jgi:hypothetical protein